MTEMLNPDVEQPSLKLMEKRFYARHSMLLRSDAPDKD